MLICLSRGVNPLIRLARTAPSDNKAKGLIPLLTNPARLVGPFDGKSLCLRAIFRQFRVNEHKTANFLSNKMARGR